MYGHPLPGGASLDHCPWHGEAPAPRGGVQCVSPVQTGSQALSLHTAVGRWAQGWSGCAGACQSGTASTACVVCSSLRQLRQHSGRARVDSARGRDILAFSGRRALHPLRDSWGSTEPKRHQTVSNQSAFLRLQKRPGYPAWNRTTPAPVCTARDIEERCFASYVLGDRIGQSTHTNPV